MGLLDGVDWEGQVFKGGAWVEGRGGTYAVVEPATGGELGTMGNADAEDVAEAAASAAEAQREWAALPHTARAAVLRKAGDLWTEHTAEIRDWNVREVGAIPPMAEFAIHVAAEECYQAAALPGQPIGQLLPSEQPRLSMARQLPAGVVAVISPFNVPIILGIRSVAPALALGNAVILKPDPRTAVTGGTLMARIFEEAGLPAGVLQMLPGGKDVGEAMVTDPHVRVISFTGSTAVGRSIGELAGRHLKRAHLELGGNSALLILDDADVEKAVGLTGWASFLNQGQICMTTGRYFVADGIYDDFVEQLAAKAGHLPVGDPNTEQVALGPVIDEGSRDKIHGLVTESVDQGARLAAGGEYDRLFYQPTVLAEVPLISPVFTQEVFGPVAPITRVSSVEDAVRLAAESDYGLSLGIVTRDVMRGAGARRADPDRHRAHQRPDGERRGERPVRRARRVGHRPARRRGGEHRGLHRDPVDHDARGAGQLPVLTSSASASPSGLASATRCPPSTTVGSIPSRSFRYSRWSDSGKSRSWRPVIAVVGTSGHASSGHGSPHGFSACCGLAAGVDRLGHLRPARRGRRSPRSSHGRRGSGTPTAPHHSLNVSPGFGTMALSSTRRRTSSRSTASGAENPPSDCATRVTSPASPAAPRSRRRTPRARRSSSPAGRSTETVSGPSRGARRCQ